MVGMRESMNFICYGYFILKFVIFLSVHYLKFTKSKQTRREKEQAKNKKQETIPKMTIKILLCTFCCCCLQRFAKIGDLRL